MLEANKKSFKIKSKALERTFKDYKYYKSEFDAYNINEVSQDKKKTEFYQESKGALEQVEKNLLEYFYQLNSFIEEQKQNIEQEESLKEDLEKAKSTLTQVKALFPAALWNRLIEA